jgi:transcriptional regulator with XRE-family HTH domain
MTEVARRAEIAPETLWQIENGRRRDSKPWSRPRPPIILAVAQALGIDPAEALQLADYDPTHYVEESGSGGPPLMAPAALAENYARLDPEMKRAIETIVITHLKAKGYIAADAPGGSEVTMPVKTHGEESHGEVRSHGEAARGVESTPESARD